MVARALRWAVLTCRSDVGDLPAVTNSSSEAVRPTIVILHRSAATIVVLPKKKGFPSLLRKPLSSEDPVTLERVGVRLELRIGY